MQAQQLELIHYTQNTQYTRHFLHYTTNRGKKTKNKQIKTENNNNNKHKNKKKPQLISAPQDPTPQNERKKNEHPPQK